MTKQGTINKYLRSPWLESGIMIGSIVLAYFGLGILSLVPMTLEEGQMATPVISWILFAFFILSVAIAMISVIAGIGGGVIFTPIMLAFTNLDSVVVRGTGLIVAMFSGLISTGIFIKKGIGNYRLCLVMTLCQGFGALFGASLAIMTASNSGVMGEGVLRTTLGLILLALSIFLFTGGKKFEWPLVEHVDRFTKMLKLGGSYFEESEGIVKTYEVKRAPLGLVLIFLVGIMGGFFGLGGGWAITPALNIGMGLPLKLAAANSGIILGVGSCVSVWPYIFAGGIIPFFALPWLAGQVIGGFIGSYVLARVRVYVVRIILIGIMVFTGFGLITKGFEMLGLMARLPPIVQVAVFTVTLVSILVVIFTSHRGAKTGGRNGR
jgi:uncharacterized membrane protein YfcA